MDGFLVGKKKPPGLPAVFWGLALRFALRAQASPAAGGGENQKYEK
jgi:hypothetical protein